jgi:hypothetical protein
VSQKSRFSKTTNNTPFAGEFAACGTHRSSSAKTFLIDCTDVPPMAKTCLDLHVIWAGNQMTKRDTLSTLRANYTDKRKKMNLKMPILQITLIALTIPSMAFAALGGDVSTVQTDRMQMKATLPVANKSANYTVHEMKTSAGVTVREYAASTGTVFAVAWKGPTVPNLQQLMGPYFDTYSNAAKIKHVGHTHFSLQQDGLVVHASGHMRDFSGIAYIPGMLPQGVTESDIK